MTDILSEGTNLRKEAVWIALIFLLGVAAQVGGRWYLGGFLITVAALYLGAIVTGEVLQRV